jgi:hypothetical protein
MSEQEFQFASGSLDDHRKLIAVGKAQRWDVMKWAVALNVGLATASLTLVNSSVINAKQGAARLILWFAFVVAVIALFLIAHYNKRMTGARNDALHIYRYFQANGVDAATILGPKMAEMIRDLKAKRTWLYDKLEFAAFAVCLLISCVPALIVWLVTP